MIKISIAKKRRRYYYPSPIAIDKFNTQVLGALSIKLSRDYLGFFGSLSKLYTKGEQKKRLDSVVSRVKKSITLLDNMISVTTVSKEDVENLIDNIEGINESRDYFLDQAEQNKSLERKIQKVSEVTGVSPQDLNITKEIIQKGAAQVRRRTREKVVPFLKRTTPGAIGLGAELGRGAMAAAMGPFAPIAEMAGTVLKGMYGIGAGIQEKRRLRQEERLTGRLAPMARGLEPSVFERLKARRAGGPITAGFGGIARRVPVRKPSKEEMVLPLTYFFDKKAHKTKWTKEILDRFKKMEKAIGRKDGGLLGGLFGGLRKGILPLIATIGLLAGAIGSTIFAFSRLRKVWGVYTEVTEQQKEISAALKESIPKDIAAVERAGGLEAAAAKLGKTPFRHARDIAYRKVAAKKLEYAARPMWKKALGVLPAWTPVGAAARIFVPGMVKPSTTIGQEAGQTYEELITKPRGGIQLGSGGNEEIKEGMQGVQKAVEQVNDTISRQQGPVVKGASLGDPFGSGDPLMVGWVLGQVTLEDN